MPGIELRDYQKAAVLKMKNGCILCGGVGSGKSRTALAYYYILHGGSTGDDYVRMSDPPDLYVITTARKRDTKEWEGELAPFHPELYSCRFVIDSWNNIAKYRDVKNSFFIFDEQRVVGRGKWVKSFLRIAKNNRWFLLSATPGDTWQDYIPVFIANGFYKNRTEFNAKHAVFSRFTKYPKIEKYVGTGILMKHRNDILVDMEFHRETVPHDESVICGYDADTYKYVMKNRWNIFENKPLVNAGELCCELRRIVNSDPSRAERLLELTEKHPKVIIFYNFDYELEILKSLRYAGKTKVAEWNGHRHEPVPDTKRWVYLVQYSAGAEGWNCIQTDTIIFWSQNYSYRTTVQAKGRIDRLNTPFTDLYYYTLMCEAPIEKAIGLALKNKREFNEKKFAGKGW